MTEVSLQQRRLFFVAAALVLVVLVAAWFFIGRRSTSAGNTITVYYAKLDGTTLVPWTVSLGPQRDTQSVATYATAQTLAGPPPSVDAVRFPPGTHANAVRVNGSTVAVDLSKDVARSAGGSFDETGEFKALVYTLTGIPGIRAVAITVDGQQVATLPGGHLELDEPLSRSSW